MASVSSAANTRAMKISVPPHRAHELGNNISSIRARIDAASQSLPKTRSRPVRLVAVSKLKPASDILALFSSQQDDSSHRSQLHFGENYMQELLEKSKILPQGIRWHFIGALQSNKCVSLARDVEGLWAVEGVDSSKKADRLNKGWGEKAHNDSVNERLRVFVQVNTSGEDSKSGVEPSEALSLCQHIRDNCEGLKLQGLMTIGAIARSKATTSDNENEDFIVLRDVRDQIMSQLNIPDADTLELSMGMSEDFEGAIVQGSDEVRIGSTIFGTRPPKSEAKVLEDCQNPKAQ